MAKKQKRVRISNNSNTSVLQSVVFFKQSKDHPNSRWNITSAKKWLKDHNLKLLRGKSVDIVLSDSNKISQLRFRITSPRPFKRFTTKVIDENIHFILGFL